MFITLLSKLPSHGVNYALLLIWACLIYFDIYKIDLRFCLNFDLFRMALKKRILNS
jgi:hypothetical protein